MHSRIFQLELEPITDQNYLSDSFYEDHYFNGGVADYVEEVDASCCDEDIYALRNALEVFGAQYNDEQKSIAFPDNFKNLYFEKRYRALKDKVSMMTLKDFISDSYSTKKLIEDNYGYQINTQNYHFSLDAFIRNLPNKETTYYLGNVLDYHY